jgi:cysteine desulfurase/selenocysteine lyase
LSPAGRALASEAALTSASPALDVQRVRADFPILGRKINGKPLVYLDSAASTQRPRQVIDAITRLYSEDYANIHRGVHTLSERSTALHEQARATVARFLNAASPREIVFVRGATEAINLVAQSWGRANVGAGDEILITTMEHHANIVPWQMLCEQTGAGLRVVPVNDAGELLLDEFEALLSDRTKLVAVTHVSNALGTINPAEKIAKMAHARGARVLIDAAQSVQHMGVDVRAIGCDFLVFSGHKVYGPTGIGALWAREDILESMPPWQGGGDMILSVSFEKTTYNHAPHRFEAGTPNIAGAIGLAAALDHVTALGIDAIAAHERTVLEHGTRALQEIPGLRLIGTAREKASILSFTLDGVHPHDIGTILDSEGIAVRTGHHCAQPLMARFGVPATARASLGVHTTCSEMDALAAGLQHVREIFG